MLSRRTLLLLGCGALVSGCSGSSGTTGPSSQASTGLATPPGPPTRSTPSASTSTSPALPSVPPWRPSPNDVQPSAKAAAVAAVQSRLRGTSGKSVVEIVDAQYGGILASSASVLVVCRTWTAGTGDRVTEGGTTVDVRLVRSAGRWRVTSLHPAQPGGPAARPSARANRVLTNDRIVLPRASIADLRSGQVHDSVLNALLDLAGEYRIGVSVLRSGHPLNVFGTNRRSDHPQGRAFDAWQLNGRAVIDPSTPRSLVTGFMHAAAEAGSYNVGGPYQLSGTARFFSDATHRDHVHAGFQT